MNVIDAINEPERVRQRVQEPPILGSVDCVLAVLFGLPLTPEQTQTFTQATGRTEPPTTPHTEAWLVVGRRGGKSFILALIAVFLAAFRDWRPYLGPGERGTVMIIAADRKQARTILRYVRGLLHLVPMLKQLIEAERRRSYRLVQSHLD